MSIYSILSRDVGEFKISAAWPTHREDERARQRPRLYIIQSFGAAAYCINLLAGLFKFSTASQIDPLTLPTHTPVARRHPPPSYQWPI